MKEREPGGLRNNIMVLFIGVMVMNILLLAAVPYLTRVLEPEGYGLLAMAQAIAVLAITTVEYGFEFAGSRAVAQRRHEPSRLGEFVTGVLLVQFVLSILVAVIAMLLQEWVPALRDQPRLLVAAVGFSIAQGFSPLWYFNGQERLGRFIAILVGARFIATVAVFLFVNEPEDAWLVLVFWGSASIVGTLSGFLFAWRKTRFGKPTILLLRETFKSGFLLFVSRIGINGHSSAGALVLGSMTSPQQAAFFVVAERLCRPIAWLLQPINLAMLPRLSALLGYDRDQARRLAGNTLWLMGSTGMLMGVVLASLAPWVVNLFFGEGYDEAIGVLRVLALIVPLLIVNLTLCGQWLIPNGMDRSLSAVVLASLGLKVLFAAMIVPQYGALGMAYVSVAVEGFMLLGLLGALHRRRLAPWSAARGLP